MTSDLTGFFWRRLFDDVNLFKLSWHILHGTDKPQSDFLFSRVLNFLSFFWLFEAGPNKLKANKSFTDTTLLHFMNFRNKLQILQTGKQDTWLALVSGIATFYDTVIHIGLILGGGESRDWVEKGIWWYLSYLSMSILTGGFKETLFQPLLPKDLVHLRKRFTLKCNAWYIII